jgi:2-oxoglutarate dehydrogenase E1 component
LTGAAEDNVQIVNLTTPAQYFHLLRRQVKSSFRKPLIIMTPKSLLRHPLAVSDLKEMAAGSFKEVLEDPDPIQSIRRILFCSGKIFYELLQKRRTIKKSDTGIVRLEQFYPFPEIQLKAAIQKYKRARQFIWVQEEPENMGAWQFVRYRMEKLFGRSPAYIGRPEAASPATGFPAIFKQEQSRIIEIAVGPATGGKQPSEAG